MTFAQFIAALFAEMEPADWCLAAIFAALLYFTLREPILATRRQLQSIDEPGSTE